MNSTFKNSLYFFNLPAPTFNDRYSTKINKAVANTIKIFNNILKANAALFGVRVIDVYRYTIDNDNFSDGFYHIDRRHLSPSILNKVVEQVKYQ